MKAIRVHAFGGPEVLKLATVPDPVASDGQVVVRLGAAGVNPVETYVRSGRYARLPELPYTPGSDGAGIVWRKGAGTPDGINEGQRVWVSGSVCGTYAEMVVCNADQVHPLPDSKTFAQGAALGIPYTTAYRALFQRGGLKPGEAVLIHGGTGGTGMAAVQFARMKGARVVATGGTETGRVMLAAQGADVFDHNESGYEREILERVGPVNVVVEMLANANLSRDLTMLAPGGRVVIVGSRGTVELDPREIMVREAEIRGVLLFGATARELDEAHAAIGAGIRTGALEPIVAQEFPLEDASAAHESVMSAGHHGKVVLRCGEIA